MRRCGAQATIRKIAEIMGVHPTGQFTPLPYHMTQSPAWRSLSGNATKLLLELCTRFNGGNNGDLSLSLDDAAELLNIGKTTAGRAYKEPQAKGFIQKVKQGSWIRGKATTWRVTLLDHTKVHRTNEWRDWKPDEKRKETRRAWGQRKQSALDRFRNAEAAKRFPGSDPDPNERHCGPDEDRNQPRVSG